MKIYSLLLVKNEADIVRSCILDALRWSDKIIVIDNGSNDDTWDIVLQLSKQDERIVAFMRYEGAFRIGLRAKAFRTFRHEMTREDWWCVRLDADEFYKGDVRDFLATVPQYYRTVKKQSTDYILTKKDLCTLDFSQPFETLRPSITHHLAEERRERRFMRHSPWYIWLEKWRYPHPWGLVYPTPVRVDHYQYRSPQQMERRFLTRQQAKADGCGTFKHEQGKTWQDYIPREEKLLKSGRNIIKLVDNQEVVKQFARPRGIQRLIYSFLRKSKARRSYEYALLLPGMTPEPIAYHEHFRHGLLTDSDYICRLSTCNHTFRELRQRDFPERDSILADIGRFTAKLHERGILHADYSEGNILFQYENGETHVEIVDLNRLRFYRHISLERGCKNFERLDIDNESLRILATAYAESRGLDTKRCIEYVLTHRWHKHKNNVTP